MTALKRVGNALITGACMAASIVLIVTSLGLRVPILQGASNADKSSTKTHVVQSNPAAQNCSIGQNQANPYFSLCPTFAVDYNGIQGGAINANQFNVFNGPNVANHEAEFYTSDTSNVRVQNGALVLEARHQSDQGYNYTSGRIDTHGKEDFMYGKFVIRATLPSGIGTWPAIWMLPSQPKYNGNSTDVHTSYLKNGEIDIAESAGILPHTVYGIAHSYAYPDDGTDRSYYSTTNVPGNDTAYHNYELDWKPNSLTYSIDGKPFYTYTKKAGADWSSWPFDQPFYLIINLAMGGTWAGNDKAQFPGDGIDKSALPAQLNVQSINYYSYVGPN